MSLSPLSLSIVVLLTAQSAAAAIYNANAFGRMTLTAVSGEVDFSFDAANESDSLRSGSSTVVGTSRAGPFSFQAFSAEAVAVGSAFSPFPKSFAESFGDASLAITLTNYGSTAAVYDIDFYGEAQAETAIFPGEEAFAQAMMSFETQSLGVLALLSFINDTNLSANNEDVVSLAFQITLAPGSSDVLSLRVYSEGKAAGISPAPIPLPPSGVLLFAGLSALVMGRRVAATSNLSLDG